MQKLSMFNPLRCARPPSLRPFSSANSVCVLSIRASAFANSRSSRRSLGFAPHRDVSVACGNANSVKGDLPSWNIRWIGTASARANFSKVSTAGTVWPCSTREI